ncbi:MAG: hypothetical protein J6S00_02215 [Clostridia bacterium]|nr:hypothetical protein [Clostridia bacterium]
MLKRALVLLLCTSLVFATAACKSKNDDKNSSLEIYNSIPEPILDENGVPKLAGANKYTDPSIYTIDTLVSMGVEKERKTTNEIQSKAKALQKQILNNPDTLVPAEGGKYIYVANGGVDRRGYGETPEKPFATIEYANLVAKAGDVVLLKRGHFWRTKVVGKEGVSYGAYGKGDKPTIYGSRFNAAEKEWERVQRNVYKVQSGTGSDIGLIVFDHGKAIGTKCNELSWLSKDYDFYCSGGYVYVYSSKGKPSKRFDDIEICPTEHIVKVESNSTIQNWRVMYGGAHGISMSNVENVKFDGCVVGYIGGGFQGGLSSSTVRYGNGIEVWGSCDGYTITNCNVFQCYDAGITMQHIDSGDNFVKEHNILFENNLLELNNYNIEYFVTGESTYKNVAIKNNVIRGGGYGWGFYSRGDREYGTNIMGGGTNFSENFVYTNNVFEHAKSLMITVGGRTVDDVPKFVGNTFAMYYNIERAFEYREKKLYFNKHGKDIFKTVIGDEKANVIFY